MQSVVLVYQPMLPDAKRLAERCCRGVQEAGFHPRLVSAWELSAAVDSTDLRLAVTFGGDGTIIRTARWLAGTGVPIVGVAMGKLGFLTELPPESACDKLPSILAGNYWVDERLMLSAVVNPSSKRGNGGDADPGVGDSGSSPLIALNDVVIARGASPRVMQIDVAVDGAPLVSYVADGLILASPTGSTAYALSAGGPVLAPGVQGILMVPVAAHLAVLKSLVVPLTSKLEVRASADQPALLVLDGQQQIPLRNGQPVTVGVAQERTIFARTGNPTRFYETLMQSLKKR
ncbi:MAG TPA: NAD(+)/NADH kinase [Chloroflexota bacterium]|nr:NAD(+)/NADH kinase [Chloroflexota bacterium]